MNVNAIVIIFYCGVPSIMEVVVPNFTPIIRFNTLGGMVE